MPNNESVVSNIIAKNINHYMKHYKISRKELAKRLDVSSATIGYWCTGKKVPRLPKIDEMCKIFQVTRGQIVEEHVPSPQPVEIGTTISVSFPRKSRGPKFSNLANPAVSYSFVGLSKDEMQIISWYRAGKYKSIVNMMMEKMTEGK